MIDWPKEIPIIAALAAEYQVDPLFIAAVRVAENGPVGKEFGVEDPAANTYELQCREACATVRDRLTSYYPGNPLVLKPSGPIKRVCYSPAFIGEFQRVWAPTTNATNDPQNLNRFWLTNASAAYARFIAAGTIA